MKAAFKWRLQNGLYGYITDESENGDPFAYDIAQQSRIYSGGTIIPEYPVDEGAISTSVSKMSKQSYTDAFNKFKQFINSIYPQVSLLDVIYYYNMENDECTASATSLKCSATDIIFKATAVTGDTLSVTVDNEQSRPDEGNPLKYRLDFVFPINGGGGDTNTNRQVRVNGDMFIENTNTTTPINLSAGTNITLTTGASGTVTIKATDTNTWRPVRVNGGDFISSDDTTSLHLSAGTNVTLITGSSGTVGIEVSDSWRPVMVDGDVFLTGATNPLKLSACTNVTLITGDSGTVGIAAKDSWRIIKVNDRNFITDGTTQLNLSAGTNVTLTTGSSGTVGINFTGGEDTKVTQEVKDQDDDDFRPMILGISWNSHNPPTFQTKTDKVYACNKIYSSVDTGYMYANNYYVNETPYGRISVTDLMPTGSITMWPGDTAPTGWVICDGSDFGVTKLLSWNVGVTKFTSSKQGQKLGGILAATSANDTWPYYKDRKVCLFRKGTGATTFQICTSATVSTVSDKVKITNATWVNYTSSVTPREFNSTELGDAWNDYSKLDFSELSGTDITLGKMVCLPDFRLRFPFGATSSKFNKMEIIWRDYVPSSLKSIGGTAVTLTDIIDSDGNKTSVIPSWATSVLFNQLRDKIYDDYLDGLINSNYLLASKDGEIEHELTIDEMPKHHHKLSTNNDPLLSGSTEYRVPDYDTANNVFIDGNTGSNPYVVDVVNGYNYNSRGIDDALRITDSPPDTEEEPGVQIPRAVEEKDYYYVHSTGGSKPHNNMPPFIAINFIIKYA